MSGPGRLTPERLKVATIVALRTCGYEHGMVTTPEIIKFAICGEALTDAAGSFTCAEADAIAVLLMVGGGDWATEFMSQHIGSSDDVGDRHHPDFGLDEDDEVMLARPISDYR